MDKKYNSKNPLEDINFLEKYRKNINESIDKMIDDLIIADRAEKASNRSFGFIKESFENMSPDLINISGGKSLMNKYTKTIKENKNLSNLHSLYENVRKAHKNLDVDLFVENISNANWDIDSNTVNKDCKKLGNLLAEAYKMIGKKSEGYLANENQELSNALLYIAENKKTLKNIAEYSNAMQIIKENILSNETCENKFKEKNLDEVAADLVREFNNKYQGKLDEDEVQIIKDLSECNDKEKVFEKYKSNCFMKIKEAKEKFTTNGDTSGADRLNLISEQLKGKTYSESTFGTDICNLIEISRILD